ncbi:hypothetical protein HHK36_018877 [Tetracentron sinense]|uniref:C2 domain-containing protein n=1 Tax=Tetracentron sinense TaxID=13715 RepID=A0A835D8N0_TETSI|nr:hypothetical protein HHK36_018877 [Tetracentron sinense]
MAASRPPSKLLDLDITIISAKHLKNVNWRHGDLKPYAIFWLDPDRRISTKPDDSASTRPVWNERFTLPITPSLPESLLTLEIFHSKPSQTPKPLVGTLRFPLKDLLHSDDSNLIRTFELRRPSGRPQGKIRMKLAIRERPPPPPPDYHITHLPSYYYSTAPPPTRDYRGYSPSPYSGHLPSPPPAPAPSPPPASPYSYGTYSDPYSGYYSGYYSQPPPPPRPFFDRASNYGGPSAPVDFPPYDQRAKGSKMGLGTGLAVGAVAGAMAGLALDEGLKYEEEKIAERVESDMAASDNYSDYRDY